MSVDFAAFTEKINWNNLKQVITGFGIHKTVLSFTFSPLRHALIFVILLWVFWTFHHVKANKTEGIIRKNREKRHTPAVLLRKRQTDIPPYDVAERLSEDSIITQGKRERETVLQRQSTVSALRGFNCKYPIWIIIWTSVPEEENRTTVWRINSETVYQDRVITGQSKRQNHKRKWGKGCWLLQYVSK